MKINRFVFLSLCLCFFLYLSTSPSLPASRLSHNNTSPITRSLLSINQLIPNRSLRNAIEDEQAKKNETKESSTTSAITTTTTTATAGGDDGLEAYQEQEKPTVTLSYKLGATADAASFELLASITPPADVLAERSGCDVCCVGKSDGLCWELLWCGVVL